MSKIINVSGFSISKSLGKEKVKQTKEPKSTYYINSDVASIISGAPETNKLTVDELRTNNKGNPDKYWYNKTQFSEGIRRIANTNYFYRSKWEANYARYLQVLKTKGLILDWQFEPDKFYFNNAKGKQAVKAYVPDFKVFYKEGTFEYHEVKGYMDSKAKTKLKRFAEHNPTLNIKIIDKNWFKAFEQLNHPIDGWEF